MNELYKKTLLCINKHCFVNIYLSYCFEEKKSLILIIGPICNVRLLFLKNSTKKNKKTMNFLYSPIRSLERENDILFCCLTLYIPRGGIYKGSHRDRSHKICTIYQAIAFVIYVFMREKVQMQCINFILV